MPDNKRILITGSNGYIGSVMAPWFQNQGYDVVGLDTGYFAQCTLVPDVAKIPTINRDIRDITAQDLDGYDAIIHLAALSNDPIGNLNEAWTREINGHGTVHLATAAKQAAVPRFIFSSSCIMYGMSDVAVVNEESSLDPKTEYARSKVRCEQAISAFADDGFSPTFIRNGTVYGLSPRMRFDTVLNDLVGSAVTSGKVILHSDGKPWRPVVHVSDVARAFLAVLEAPIENVHNQAFNTGAEIVNHQIIELAEIVAETVPGCAVEVQARPGADQRTYKTDFSKFARTFPDFEFRWTARKGVQDLYQAFQTAGLSRNDFVDKKFTRLKWLRYLLDTKKLNNALRWNNGWNETWSRISN